jgi:hypothetical protein
MSDYTSITDGDGAASCTVDEKEISMKRFFKVVSCLLLAAPVFAGTILLDFGNPKAASDPAAQGALMTVRLIGCHPELLPGAMISGTAEGLVNGKRVSAPVRIISLATAGLYAVQWERPAEGKWVLAFQVRVGDSTGTAIEPLGTNGFDRKPKPLNFSARGESVDAALRAAR